MDDTFKWSLIALFAGIFVFLGGVWLGIDWTNAQATMLSFLVLLGELLILFTGSAAAVEVAKFFRKKNRMLDQNDSSAMPEQEARLREWMSHSLAESLAPIQDSVEDMRTELDSMEREQVPDRYGRSR